MPFDVDDERYTPRTAQQMLLSNEPMPSKDLETIVTLLEVAALSLTNRADATFTKAQLLDQMRVIAGGSIEIAEQEVDNVFDKTSFIKKVRGAELCLK